MIFFVVIYDFPTLFQGELKKVPCSDMDKQNRFWKRYTVRLADRFCSSATVYAFSCTTYLHWTA